MDDSDKHASLLPGGGAGGPGAGGPGGRGAGGPGGPGGLDSQTLSQGILKEEVSLYC